MAVQMSRPTRHPKSGTYRVRLMIPPHLAATAHQMLGVRTELVENLKTKDMREAVRLGPAALARLHVRLDAITLAHAGGGKVPTDRDMAALAGEAYRCRIEEQGGAAGSPSQWAHSQALLYDRIDGPDEDGDLHVRSSPNERAEALWMLQVGGWRTDAPYVAQVAEKITLARLNFAQTMQRRAADDWSPDPVAHTFPPPSAPVVPAAPAVLFDALVAGWAKDHGHRLAPPISRAAYDRQRTIARLGAFLGHQDGARVAKADVVRWKVDMQERGLAIATQRNDLSEMSAIWKWAMRQGTLDTNPFEGVSPPKPKRGQTGLRRAFTNEEATRALIAARLNVGFMRWAPWVCCLAGVRLGELTQAVKEDLFEVDGVRVLRIHAETDDEWAPRDVKNPDSLRRVPVHPGLIAEGFLAYVDGLPPGSPLFPDAPRDALFAKRSGVVGKKVAKWVRGELGITDRRISPSHSWRHWFIDAARGVVMNPEVRSALTGHSARIDESAGYGAGMQSFVRVLFEAIATIKPPVPPP
jgi:hypothetical protein